MEHLGPLGIHKLDFPKNTVLNPNVALSGLFEHSADWICIHRPGDHFTNVNGAFLKATGYDPNKINTQIWEDLVHPQEREELKLHLAQLFREDSQARIEHRFCLSDGSYRWTSWHAHSLDQTVFAIGRDITEAKDDQERLAGMAKKFRELVEHSPFCIHEIDLNGGMLSMNQAGLELLGLTRDVELEGKKYQDFIQPEDQERISSLMDLAVGGDSQYFEFELMEGGKKRILSSCFIPIGDGQNRVERLMGITQDITQERMAQAALAESEEKYRTLIEKAPIGIGLADTEGNLLAFNEAILRPGKYTRSDVQNINNVADFYSDQQERDRILERFRRKGFLDQTEVRFKRKDGTDYLASLSLRPVRLKGQPYYMASVFDITEMKNREKEREDLLDELDRFVYNASHDLSAPLKSIRGLIQLAKMDSAETKKVDYLDKMELSVSRLESFIGDIMDYSRNSQLEVMEEELEAQELVEDVLENLKFMEGYEEIDFKVRIRGNSPINTDPFRLKIILNNLFSNAIKFHRPGADPKPYVDIKVRTRIKGFTIEVEDNGQGIPKRHQPQIFDMFYRANSKASGSGLGLYIAQETAKRINGVLEFSSQRGQGSLFRLVVNYPWE